MENLKERLLRAANGEPIEAIVIGRPGIGFDWDSDPFTDAERGVVLTWEQAAPKLDYVFDNDRYIACCHALYAWTASKIFFMEEDEGQVYLRSLPRNPTAVMPWFMGH